MAEKKVTPKRPGSTAAKASEKKEAATRVSKGGGKRMGGSKRLGGSKRMGGSKRLGGSKRMGVGRRG